MRFEAVEFDQEDVDAHIEDDKLIVKITNVGGKFSGHSLKYGLFYTKEEYDFDMYFKKNGIENFGMESVRRDNLR